MSITAIYLGVKPFQPPPGVVIKHLLDKPLPKPAVEQSPVITSTTRAGSKALIEKGRRNRAAILDLIDRDGTVDALSIRDELEISITSVRKHLARLADQIEIVMPQKRGVQPITWRKRK